MSQTRVALMIVPYDSGNRGVRMGAGPTRLLESGIASALHADGYALGTLSGLAQDDIGIMWFDAHGDFNTPETMWSGFFDGMALATATGKCWSPSRKLEWHSAFGQQLSPPTIPVLIRTEP